MVTFLAELNKLLPWGGDVGNAYIEALTKEKLYILAGPEFGELQGHILIIYKALYGTRTGGACWQDKLFDTLQQMGFQPSKADPDIWMKPTDDGQVYAYIAVYVDNLCVASGDPGKIFQTLKNNYKFKLMGYDPLDYHLGYSYKRDPDDTLVADPRKYVSKSIESYERMFSTKPKKAKPPLEAADHPELHQSDFCNEEEIKQYQTLIGQLQWLISLGRFDIAVHTMSLSRYRAQPQKGHLDRVKRIFGYLAYLPEGAVRFRTGEPDFSDIQDQEFD